MNKMPQELMNMFNELPPGNKVIATCDTNGRINVSPRGTIAAIDDKTLAYAEIWEFSNDETIANLKATKKAAVLLFKYGLPPTTYQVRGTFQSFQTSGPLFDRFTKSIKERAGKDVKAVGIIKVDEVDSLDPHKSPKIDY